jgi:chlorobactene glucosyltransferase
MGHWIYAFLPWLLGPILMAWRARGSPGLADDSPSPPDNLVLVSVIVPARNEARNIERCAASVLQSTWPALEVIVVDDRSDDDTGRIARALAARDPRLRVIAGAPVPAGWFGKQWACAQGAAAASGSTLIFTDADTTHAPDLIARTMSAMRTRALGFFTVAGSQEYGTFWERVVMPQIFYMLAMRFGGAGEVNRARRARDKIANGQYLCFTRAAYDAIGGHESVRTKPAEDLALAQRAFALGVPCEVVLGPEQLSTRMYTSLAEIVNGWTKNIITGAADTLPRAAAPRILLPVLLAIAPLMHLVPPVVLLAAAFVPLAPGLVAWAAACTVLLVLWWAFLYPRAFQQSSLYALMLPLGAAVVLFIVARATVRGRGVEWKGRRYQVG